MRGISCACGTLLAGSRFADATNPPTSVDGPWLCGLCASDANRERPGSVVVIVDLDTAARQVAAALSGPAVSR